MVSWLLERGTNPSCLNKVGHRPLDRLTPCTFCVCVCDAGHLSCICCAPKCRTKREVGSRYNVAGPLPANPPIVYATFLIISYYQENTLSYQKSKSNCNGWSHVLNRGGRDVSWVRISEAKSCTQNKQKGRSMFVYYKGFSPKVKCDEGGNVNETCIKAPSKPLYSLADDSCLSQSIEIESFVD